MGRPKLPRTNKVSVNLSIKRANKDGGMRIATERYGISLSEMVDRFLEREGSLKGGLLNPKISTR